MSAARYDAAQPVDANTVLRCPSVSPAPGVCPCRLGCASPIPPFRIASPMPRRADAGPIASWKSLDMQHQQILQRCESFALCCVFAETDEAAQLIAKFRQSFEIVFLQA